MKITWGRVLFIAVAIGIIYLIVITMLPSPIAVDAARVERGPLRVTVDEEGEVRVHDRFIIAAPIVGRMARIELHDGDRVERGQVVASIYPTPIDVKERAEVLSRVRAAEALKREADERVAHAREDYEQARRESARMESLAKQGVVSAQAFEQAKNAEVTSKNEFDAARARAQAAASEVEIARAGLVAIDSEASNATRAVKLRSPVAGCVLRVVEKSERVVTQGMPLIIIGNPELLEVVVDLLSTDAVKVKPGMPVLLENWGGDAAIRARVRVVESGAFTKVSALGIEEQRTNIVADFVDSPGPLGDGYRVEAKVVIWESDGVLKVPTSALFRHGDNWAVFVIEEGRAQTRNLEIGHRSQFEAEVLSGIEEGAMVILHPSNQIEDVRRVSVR
ncbi:MAG TPA: HlyD family efflux transporter periplasmic adaptor subunit [Blastocatellia bacterium]|nr:HlyD family efflux transporter periplasmic adaptor subunit [Blastocatellia bacterium]